MRGVVYERAARHVGRGWPEAIPRSQAYVPGGFYLGWLVRRGLVSAPFRRRMRERLRAFAARRLTGPKLFEACDGVLRRSMLSDEGAAFTAALHAEPESNYMEEFAWLYDLPFDYDLPLTFQATDTRENAAVAERFLDGLLADWRRAFASGAPTFGPGYRTRGPFRVIHADADDARRCLFKRLLPLLETSGFRAVRGRPDIEVFDRAAGRRRRFAFIRNSYPSSTSIWIEVCVGFDAVDRLAWRAEGGDERTAREKQAVAATDIYELGATVIHDLGRWATTRRNYDDVWADLSSAVLERGLPFLESISSIEDAVALFERALAAKKPPKWLGHMHVRHLCCLYCLRDRTGLDAAHRRWNRRFPGSDGPNPWAEQVAKFLSDHWDENLDA